MKHMQQETDTDGRAEHRQRVLCTAATRGLWHGITAALSTPPEAAPMSPAAVGRPSRLWPSASGHNLLHERAVSGQCSLICRVAHTCGERTGSCQQVIATSTIGSPATMAHGTVSVPMAEAIAGSCSGSSSMSEHWMWRCTMDCCMTWWSRFVTGVHVGVHVAATAQRFHRFARDLQLGLRTQLLSAVLRARDMSRCPADSKRSLGNRSELNPQPP